MVFREREFGDLVAGGVLWEGEGERCFPGECGGDAMAGYAESSVDERGEFPSQHEDVRVWHVGGLRGVELFCV